MFGLVFETTRGRMIGRPYVGGSTRLTPVCLAAPSGSVVRSFYGRVASGPPKAISGLGVVFGPAVSAPWRQATTRAERFSDAADARARAVLDLSADARNARFGALPLPLVYKTLAFAISLFDD